MVALAVMVSGMMNLQVMLAVKLGVTKTDRGGGSVISKGIVIRAQGL